MSAWPEEAVREVAIVNEALENAERSLAELRSWADRMHGALEQIVEGLREYVDEDGSAYLSAEEVVQIARRALNPDEWERIT